MIAVVRHSDVVIVTFVSCGEVLFSLLSVCVSAGRLKKLWVDFHEI